MKTRRPEISLEHVLTALERELIDATDDEVLAAAAELGMNPSMKGSAAFLGVNSPLVHSRAGCGTESASDEHAGLSHRERSGPGGS